MSAPLRPSGRSGRHWPCTGSGLARAFSACRRTRASRTESCTAAARRAAPTACRAVHGTAGWTSRKAGMGRCSTCTCRALPVQRDRSRWRGEQCGQEAPGRDPAGRRDHFPGSQGGGHGLYGGSAGSARQCGGVAGSVNQRLGLRLLGLRILGVILYRLIESSRADSPLQVGAGELLAGERHKSALHDVAGVFGLFQFPTTPPEKS